MVAEGRGAVDNTPDIVSLLTPQGAQHSLENHAGNWPNKFPQQTCAGLGSHHCGRVRGQRQAQPTSQPSGLPSLPQFPAQRGKKCAFSQRTNGVWKFHSETAKGDWALAQMRIRSLL